MSNTMIVHAEEFDPPLTGNQIQKIQEIINEAIRRDREER